MSKNVTIVIDTSGSEAVFVSLETADKKRVDMKKPVSRSKAQEVLPMLEILLMEHGLKMRQITAIRVNTGPGSYTGLRVGIAVANMLGTLLGISINGLPVGKTVTPVYESDRW